MVMGMKHRIFSYRRDDAQLRIMLVCICNKFNKYSSSCIFKRGKRSQCVSNM